jgi:subtilisin family serine protease
MKLAKSLCAVASAGLIVSATPAFARKGATAYFQLTPGAAAPPAATPVSFALSDAQKQAIFDATGGKVDFRNIVAVDTDGHDSHKLRRMNGFDSIQQRGVPPPVLTDATPDPELKGQWWIDKDNVPAAWASGVSGKGVVVADCDSGFYLDEPDLHANMLVDHRFDLADKDDPFNVVDGGFIFHGTAVAAIIAGVHDGAGTNGIAYDAKYVPLQNFNYDSSKDDLDKEEATARCILRALTVQGVKVIVLENQTSGGSSETFAGTRQAVRLALLMGATVVSAAGNYSVELTAEAADDTGSIIVGALGQDGKMAYFSNFGSRISVAAFGENLHTLYGPDGAFGDFGGTSGATPQVAASVALMLEANPKLTPAQIKDALTSTRVESDDTHKVGGALDTAGAVAKVRTLRPDFDALAKSEALRGEILAILADYPATH